MTCSRAFHDGTMLYDASRVGNALYWDNWKHFDLLAFKQTQPAILMEYLDELDRNGKDICVGDVVKYHNQHHVNSFTEYDIYFEVVRIGSRFLQKNFEYSPDMWYEWDEVEVVGNVCEGFVVMGLVMRWT